MMLLGERASRAGGSMTNLAELVQFVLSEPAAQETDWLEWKSQADLSQRLWQARAARFILATANRPRAPSVNPYEGRAFLLLGVEPGQAHGTNVVDPAVVERGLARYLATVGPAHSLEYVTVQGVTVAIITVPSSTPGTRPYLARGSLSADRPEIQDGRIYIRRPGISAEASAAEIDEMLAERVATRVAAGPLWPMQAEPAWRDGNTIHVRQQHGDRVVIHAPDTYTNLSEMAAIRPSLPETLPPDIAQRVAVFDPLLDRADTEPYQAVEAAWSSLRIITVEVYEQRLRPLPIQGFKVIDMVTEMADQGIVQPRWVDVAYPLYYWAIAQSPEGIVQPRWVDAAQSLDYWGIGQSPGTSSANPGIAKSYVALAKALATALLLAAKDTASGETG
jgi:hypothetical protein